MIISSDNANLNTSVAGAGSSNPFHVQQAGSWMNELERALLSEQPVQQDVQSSNVDAGAPDSNANETAVSLQSNGFASSEQNAPTSRASEPSADINSASGKATESQDGNDGNVATQKSMAQGVSTTNTLRGTADKSSATTKENVSNSHVTTVKTKQVAASPVLASLSPTVAVAMPLVVPSAAVLMQQIKQYQGAGEVESLPGMNSVTAISRALPTPASLPQISAPVVAQQKTGIIGDEQTGLLQETATENQGASETEAYPERQLHVFQSDDGVQAWIRDAGLSQSQAYAVGQAMDSELRNTGSKLNGLVLNGKKVAGIYQGNLFNEPQGLASQARQAGGVSDSSVMVGQEFNEKGVV